MWEDDRAAGLGSLEYANNDLYEGSWQNDQRHGTGKFISMISGLPCVYEGEWRDGMKVIIFD